MSFTKSTGRASAGGSLETSVSAAMTISDSAHNRLQIPIIQARSTLLLVPPPNHFFPIENLQTEPTSDPTHPRRISFIRRIALPIYSQSDPTFTYGNWR